MPAFSLTNLLRKIRGNGRRIALSSRRGFSRPRSVPLHIEALEERLVPVASLNLTGVIAHPPSVTNTTPLVLQTSPVPGGYAPNQIDAAYGFDKLHNAGIDGSGQMIAIVDPYDVAHSQSPGVPDLQSDINVFDKEYGLPYLPLQVQYQSQNPNSPPPAPVDFAWTREAALDIEWAHAIAPGANIVLFEATSQDDADLMATVNVARNYPGVSVVSMSWGISEASTFVNDSYFTTPAGHVPISFVASTGDKGNNGGMMQYPATSPYVLAVGGTTLNLASQSGAYGSETAWSGSGGGVSQFTPEPAYQNQANIKTSNGNRAVPDVAYDGDTNTPVSTYDTQYGWDVGAGTSAGAPQWAGLIALANQVRANLHASPLGDTVADIYSLPAGDFHDITSGSNGSYSAGPGYDLVTGRGTPMANLLVGDLARSEPTGFSGGLPTPLPSGNPVDGTLGTTGSTGGIYTAGGPWQIYHPQPNPYPSVAGDLINLTINFNSDVLAIQTVTASATAGSFTFTGAVDVGATVTGTLTWSGTSYQLNGSWTASGHTNSLAGQITSPGGKWNGDLQFLGTYAIDNALPWQVAGSQISLVGSHFQGQGGNLQSFTIQSMTWTPPSPPARAQQGSYENQATENYTFTGILNGQPGIPITGTLAWNSTTNSFHLLSSWFQNQGGQEALDITISANNGNLWSGELLFSGWEDLYGYGEWERVSGNGSLAPTTPPPNPYPIMQGDLINLTTISDILAIQTVTWGAAAGSFNFTGAEDAGATVTGTLTWSGTSYQLSGSWTVSGHTYHLAGQLTSPGNTWNGNIQFLGKYAIDNGLPGQVAGSQISLAGDTFDFFTTASNDYADTVAIQSITWTGSESYTFTGLTHSNVHPTSGYDSGSLDWNSTTNSFQLKDWSGLDVTITAPNGNWSSGLQLAGTWNGTTPSDGSGVHQVYGSLDGSSPAVAVAKVSTPVVLSAAGTMQAKLALVVPSGLGGQATNDDAFASPLESTADKTTHANLPRLLAGVHTPQEAKLLVDCLFDSTNAGQLNGLVSTGLAGSGKATR